MKRFKDLNNIQKKQAVDILFDKVTQDIISGKNIPTEKIKEKIDQIKAKEFFCGCLGCVNSLLFNLKKDSQVKEYILDQAQLTAELAYYPEQDESVIKVD